MKEKPFCPVCKSKNVTWRDNPEPEMVGFKIGHCYNHFCINDWPSNFEFYWGVDDSIHWI